MEWDKRRMTGRGKFDVVDTDLESDVPDGKLIFSYLLFDSIARTQFKFLLCLLKEWNDWCFLIWIDCEVHLRFNYNVWSIVKNVVGDGALTNKSAFLEMGKWKIGRGCSFLFTSTWLQKKYSFSFFEMHEKSSHQPKKVLIGFDEEVSYKFLKFTISK